MCRKWMLAGLGLLACAVACNGLKIVPGPNGQLNVNVSAEKSYGVKTRASGTDDYHFLLVNAAGDTIRKATVSEISGTPLSLEPGLYKVIVYNRTFTAPEFDAPYYYAEETAEIISGQTSEVELTCLQENSGIRVLFGDQFMEKYPQYAMTVTGDLGSLDYNSLTSGCWGYFSAGEVTLSLKDNDSLLGSIERTLEKKHMYTFLVNNTEDPEGIVESSFILSVDTTHVWVSQDWDTSVTSGDGQTRASAYSVTQARELTDGTEGIWVCGYITGSYSGSTTYNPGSITTDTNIALADQPGEQAADKTLSVRLDTENLKAQLSLSRNNSNLNRRVWLKGTSNAKYFGQPGLESIKETVW